MSDSVSFSIGRGQLAALGQLVPGAKTRISPLRGDGAETLGEDDQAELRRGGILDEGGGIADELRPTLDLLARTRAYTSVRFRAGPEVLEYNVYFGPDDGRVVAVTPSGEGLLIEEPAPTGAFLEGVRAYSGGSIIRICEFDEELPTDQALTLSALLDLQRKAVLRAFADGTELPQATYDAAAVRRAIAETESNAQWFVSLVQDLRGSESIPDEREVGEALQALSEAGHLIDMGTGYALGETASVLGSRFLMFDTMTSVWSGREREDGTVFDLQFLCGQAGVHEIMFVECSEERCQFTTLNSEALLAYVRHFLEERDALQEMMEELVAEGALVPRQAFCNNCGNQVSAEDRFCSNCGHRLG